MGLLSRIRKRHRMIKNQIDTPMTEDTGRRLFPRYFTKWLNQGLLTFNRHDGMYYFTKQPILQEDCLISYVASNPNSTTEEIADELEVNEAHCYRALMSLRSQGRDSNFLIYSQGRWSIGDTVDLSFLYWNENGLTSDLTDKNDMVGLLARHIRDVFLAKEAFQSVERDYNKAQQGLVEKKQNFKNQLEELDLI